MNFRTTAGNALLLLMLGVALAAAITIQRDRNASHPRPPGESQVTWTRLDEALRRAKALHKYLMVEFGGDWCADCVVLNRNLQTDVTRDYFQEHFFLLRVEVDHSDRNLDVAKSLDAGVEHGVPAAVFFAPDGSRIGATTRGELEPSRNYDSKQILAFLKAIVERGVVTTPLRFADSRRIDAARSEQRSQATEHDGQ